MTDLNACARLYGHHLVPKRLDPAATLNPHFSGYPVPPKHGGTVAEAEAYYVHGLPGPTGHPPDDPHLWADLGKPISGDQTARWAHWHRTGNFPTYAELPSPAFGHKPAGALF